MTHLLLKTHSTKPGEFLELEAGNDGLIFRKELIYADNFVKKTKDGVQHFTVDENKIKHWNKYGNMMIQNGIKIPVPIKHTDNPEANRASIIRFETGTNDEGVPALFGVMKFRDVEAAALAASTDVSIYVPSETFVDGKGREYPYTIKHVALTDYPVIPGLSDFEAIEASYDSELSLANQPEMSRSTHALHAAGHAGMAALEYDHARHIGKHFGKFGKSQFSKGFKSGGTVGGLKRLGRVAVRAGVRGSLKKYALPVALGGLAAHGAITGGMHAIKHLSKMPKAPKGPVTLSLQFDNSQPRDSDGKWKKVGRGIAAAGVGGVATAALVKAIGKPAAVHLSRQILKKTGATVKGLSATEKAIMALESSENLAHGAGLSYVAKRIKDKPSEDVKPDSKIKHLAKSVGLAGIGTSLTAGALKQAIDTAKHVSTTAKAVKVAEQIYRNNDKSKKVRVIAHALLTRPTAALAAASAIGGTGLGYGAYRALRKAKMHAKAKEPIEASLELSDGVFVPEHVHANIYGRVGGRFARKPGGNATPRSMKKLRRLQGEHHYIRDDSDENVHSKDRVTHALQALKHASIGVIEGGLAANAVLEAGKLSKVKFAKILAAPLKGGRGKAARTVAIKGIASGLAGAAAATDLFANRIEAVRTHINGALGKR